MIKNLFSCCSSILLLTACVSVSEPSVVAPADFVENALLYTFKEPTWRLTDDVYEQALGKYHIVNANVSGQSTESSVKEREIYLNYFLNWAFLGESLQKDVERWDTMTQQHYSFQLDGQYDGQYSPSCEVLIGGATEHEKKSNVEMNITYQSKLLCKIVNNDKTWNLLIEKLADRSRTAKLWQADNTYNIEFSKQELNVFDNDVNLQHKKPLWLLNERVSGVFIYESNKLIAINSLVGKPKIWLLNRLNEQERALLLSINYAISMYDWLTDDFQ
tara:strand:+ start:241 stop:1062 length:822 start_codon:yes stop_codon:yes gene_type:complete